MHRHTPSITVIEPRGLPVRELAYHRRATGGLLETRVTHQVHDVAGRLCEQRDPRLFVSSLTDPDVPVNLRTIYSLSGQSLCSDSVDAGWQLSLPGPDGLTVETWDQRGWHRRIEYDLLLRPVAVVEHFKGYPERCAERITWGRYTADDALRNRCGVPVRHDDPAGSRLLPEYAMAGSALAEVRHFHKSVESPGWPLDEVERDRLLELGDGARSTWHFAPTGEVSGQTDAKGHTRHLRYDRGGQLCGIRLQQAQRTTAEILVGGIEYSAAGQVLHELAGNGMRIFSSYDPASGQLLTLANQSPDGSYLQNLSYRHDPAGNIIVITEDALPLQHFANQRIEPVRHFTYDTLYQLIKATGWESAKPSLGPALPEWQAFGSADSSRWCNYTETYFYDAAGNLLQRVHQGAVNDTLTMQVAAHSNRSIKDRPGAELDELFDARGNFVELQPGRSLQWNGRNELSEVVQVARHNAPGDREFYSYDHEGMRVRKCRTAAAKSIIHSAEVRYLPGLELHSNSGTGEQLQVLSIQAGRCSVRLLHWDSPPPEGVDNDQLRYCFDDHLGSSAFEVDADAKTISQEVYYPFGGTAWLAGRHEGEISYKIIRYSGKERDATGFYYYGARYYAPWLQRWLNPDPAGKIDGLNFFRFVRNNSIGQVDADGYKPNNPNDERSEFEQSFGFDGSQAWRGIEKITNEAPDVARVLKEAFANAKSQLERAIASLAVTPLPDDVQENIEAFFGKVSAYNFKVMVDAYKSAVSYAGLSDNTQKIIIFDNPESPMNAFVLEGDDAVYFNYSFVKSAPVWELTFTVLHELTHMDEVLSSLDNWYLSRADTQDPETNCTAPINTIWIGRRKDTSREILSSVDLNSQKNTLLGERMVDSYVEYFNISADMRRELAFTNADTHAMFIQALNPVTRRK